MDCFKKNIIRFVFSASLFILVLSLLAVSNASAAAKYRDDIPVPFSQIVWDHTDVSGWQVNSDLHEVYISGGQINMPHTQACGWPMYDHAVNANAWVIHKNSDGRWHANTWDFMRKCQTSKGEHDVGWGSARPYHGQELYFLMSGIARPGYAETTHSRSNVVKYYWGSGVGKALPTEPPCYGPPIISSFTASPINIRPGDIIELKWNVTDADGLQLTTNDGDSASLSKHDPFVEGLDVSPAQNTTYTLGASNECGTAETKKVEVVVSRGLPFISPLILYAAGDVLTLSAPTETIEGTSAKVQGEVTTPTGKDVTVSFEYGTSTSYGGEVNATPATVTGENILFEGSLSGLKVGTTYHYKAKALLKNKITYGVDKTFLTDDKPSSVTNEATAVTGSGATLNGFVDPNGDDATVSFEYGQSTSYGTSTFGVPRTLNGSSAQASKAVLSRLLPGTIYHYRVTAFNTVGSGAGNDKSFTTDALLPNIATVTPSDVIATGFKLTGLVNPNGASTDIIFECGLTTEYGINITGTNSPLIGTSDQNSEAEFTGLNPYTEYHCHMTAENSIGLEDGGDFSVTTTSASPSAETVAAENVTGIAATMKGNINSNGDEATVTFEYGMNTEYGTMVNGDPLTVPAGNAVVASAATVSAGLDPGTTYHYRVKASNSHGSVDGADMTFTTLALPPEIITVDATDVSTDSAVLKATVDTNGADSIVQFKIGIAPESYVLTMPDPGVPVSNSVLSQDESYDTSGSGALTPETTYYYRATVNNGTGGQVDSTVEKSFTTLSAE